MPTGGVELLPLPRRLPRRPRGIPPLIPPPLAPVEWNENWRVSPGTVSRFSPPPVRRARSETVGGGGWPGAVVASFPNLIVTAV